MSKTIRQQRLKSNLKRFYGLVIFVLIFTGFGQMPIFKRYYIADLPGMGWAADYFITLHIHYLAASLFLGLTAYYLTGYIRRHKAWRPQEGRAWVRSVIFAMIILSGLVLAARNLPGFALPPRLIVASTLIHMSSALLFIIATATYFRLGRSRSGGTGGRD